jgi:hypothetical protein
LGRTGLTASSTVCRASADQCGITLLFAVPPTLAALGEADLQVMLDRLGGNRRMVAEILDISQRNTYRLIRKDPDAEGE